MAEDRPLPEIPECDVEPDGDGYRLIHKRTGDVEHADNDWKHVELKGALLRLSATHARTTDREVPFTAGDPT